MAKWLSIRLQTKWLWVKVLLQSLKLQISHLFRARSSVTEYGFTLKHARGMISTYSQLQPEQCVKYVQN